MRYLLAILIISLSLSLTAFAQSGGIKGKVRDDDNDRSLADVEVVVSQSGKTLKTANSSASGDFFIQGLADGIYSLSFDKDGYQRGTIRIEVKKGKVTDLNNRRLALPR